MTSLRPLHGYSRDGQDRRQETVSPTMRLLPAQEPRQWTATFEKSVNIALQDGGYPLVRDPAKVAECKLDAFVAANPELALDAAAIRAGEKTHDSG